MTVRPDRRAGSDLVGQLQLLKKRLLNLDTRNQSVFLRKLYKKRAFDLASVPDHICSLLWRQVASGSGTVTLIESSAEGPEVDEQRSSLTTLYRFATSLFEEKGLYEVHIGLCWLEGFLDEDTFVRGPVVLVPVRLGRKTGGEHQGWTVTLDEEQPPELNKALLAAIQKARGYVPSPHLGEEIRTAIKNVDGRRVDAGRRIYNDLIGALRNLELPITFEPFESRSPVPTLLKRDVQELGRWPLTVRPYAVLGIFPQANGAMFSDIEAMINRAADGELDQGIVDNLLDAPASDPDDNSANSAEVDLDAVPDREMNTVVLSDPSQSSVLVKAQRADCTVVRGPPGTGKSQVIVNLVADAMSRGEKVLVCCQKRAALDVVDQRLKSVGLGDAAFLVHDGERDRADLYKKIQGILEDPVPPASEDGMTSVLALSQRIDATIAEIQQITRPVWKPFHGTKLFELYIRAKPRFKPRMEIADWFLALQEEELQESLELFRRLQEGYIRFDRPDTPISDRKNWSNLGILDKNRLLDAVVAVLDLNSNGEPKIVVPSEEERRSYEVHIRKFLELGDRWYRRLLPSWYRARRFVADHHGELEGVDRARWIHALDQGRLLREKVATLSTWFDKKTVDRWIRDASETILHNDLEAIRGHIEKDFETIQDHDRLREHLDPDRQILIDNCFETLGEGVSWSDQLLQEVTLRWIDEAEERYPALRGNPKARYEELRTRLQGLMDEKRAAVVRELQRSVRRRQRTPTFPPGSDVHPNARARTVWNKLLHQVGKKRRLWSVRRLISEFTWPMAQIAPCWLTSPEVVSEIFPLERDFFDLVIFDEASQLDLERALPALYRASRVVVAGDEYQMPPSHWFDAQLDEDIGDDERFESTKADSLLIAAKRIYGFEYLSWHYRSEFQELIDYSNHAFYNGNLNVAANPTRDREDPAIEWVPVEGIWHNRTNHEEVMKCVDLLAQHLRDNREREEPLSIGVITFNANQMTAIQDEIDARRATDAEFQELWTQEKTRPLDDRPFVKNLENVQGDERDIILISVSYAAGPDGVFRRYFGVLNKEGGENYLNVAVTRAKKRIQILCSFDPEALAVEGLTNIGPLRFKQYLRYAKAVSERMPKIRAEVIRDLNPSTRTEHLNDQVTFESPFEEMVYDALVNRGYDVATQVGLSGYRIDLAVVDPRDPHRYVLGIECDGATFHSGKSVRERDIARQRFIESRGWTIHRVWSRNWWRDPQGEVKSIMEHLPPVR